MKKRLILTLVLILSFSLLTGCLENEEVLQEEALEEIEEVLTSFSEGVYEGNRSKVRSTLSSEDKIRMTFTENNEIQGGYIDRDEFLQEVVEDTDEWDLADNLNLSFLVEDKAEVETYYSISAMGDRFGGDAIIRLTKEDESWYINMIDMSF